MAPKIARALSITAVSNMKSVLFQNYKIGSSLPCKKTENVKYVVFFQYFSSDTPYHTCIDNVLDLDTILHTILVITYLILKQCI